MSVRHYASRGQVTAGEQAILAVLTQGPMTRTALAQKTGYSLKSVDRLSELLLASGWLCVRVVTVGGRRARAFARAEEAQA